MILLREDMVMSCKITNLSSYSRDSSKPPISLMHFNVTFLNIGTSKNYWSVRNVNVGNTRSCNKATMFVPKIYPRGTHERKRSVVSNVAEIRDSIWAFSRTSVQSWKISENSWQNWFFNLVVLWVVIFSDEKSKISSLFPISSAQHADILTYLSNFRTTMLFSHKNGFERLEMTISEINSGQFWGQSCLRI